MGADDMNSRTVAGLMAYCDWIKDKGYAGAAATDAWRSATKVVFETVDGESYEALSLDGIDLDDYIRRFQVLGGAKYRSETVGRYKNRIRSALDAQAYYLEHGKAPSFKRGTAKPKQDAVAAEPAQKATASRASSGTPRTEPSNVAMMAAPADFFDFAYPLSPGRMVHMRLPLQMTKREVDRLCTVIQTLEEQPQLPPGTAQAA